jgi:hypothetical protein
MPMAEDSDHEELLKILETHGKKFLDAFSIPPATEQANLREPVKDVEFEDWKGFGEQDDGESCSYFRHNKLFFVSQLWMDRYKQ